jgi:hypothetical protein
MPADAVRSLADIFVGAALQTVSRGWQESLQENRGSHCPIFGDHSPRSIGHCRWSAEIDIGTCCALGSAQKVSVKYLDAGYQPGDTWDLYVGADKRIQQIVYHRGRLLAAKARDS